MGGCGSTTRPLSSRAGVFDGSDTPTRTIMLHVTRLMQLPAATQVVAPHFFSFGGTLETARWMKQVGSGNFEIDVEAGKFRIGN
jgi:hypothetical protein